jgi:hypothetical protein
MNEYVQVSQLGGFWKWTCAYYSIEISERPAAAYDTFTDIAMLTYVVD